MLVVKIELHSAVTGQVSELGRMIIANDGTGTPDHGNYNVALGRKGNTSNAAVLERPSRRGRVEKHLRKHLSVWMLVRKALDSVAVW